MKSTTLALVLSITLPLGAAVAQGTKGDPLNGAFFPPELIMQTREQTGVSEEQLQAIRARMEKAQPQFEECRQKLERETAALAALAKQDRIDEMALIGQLDKLLDAEREVKHLQMGLLAAAKNQLTPEQQARLREMVKSGAAGQANELRERLTAKVQRVHEAVQKRAQSGADPSAIVETMTTKVKPLLDAGKAAEAEAEIDRVLEGLK